MSGKPNILFFFTDDQRFDTIRALGNREIQTPNIDRLIGRGTVFTNAHIPGGTSGAICMPSRAMLHSGRTLFHLQKEGQQIPEAHATLGETLKRAGYRTYGSGKWHNGTGSFARSFTDGDAIFFGGMWDHWNVPLCKYDPTGKYENAIPFTMNFMAGNKVTQVHCDEFSMGRHSTEAIADAAIRYLQLGRTKEPFFMYLSFLAPHDPRTMPERFKTMYDPDQIELPDSFAPEHPFPFGVERIRDELLASYPRTKREIQTHIAEYYGMISHLDYELGRVLEALDKSGEADNTVIVFAADNGLAVGRHGLMGKQNHYEHSIRVPLIFAGPGIPLGEVREQMVYLHDIFPTLCGLADIPVPDSVEGLSLMPLLHDPGAVLRGHLYFAYNDLIRSVKNERYKLIEYAGHTRRTQLFDLQNDPTELRNLYGEEGMEPVAASLRQALYCLRDEWDDKFHPLGERFWNSYESL